MCYLVVGQTENVTAKLSPSNASDKSVIWSVDDSSIATVSNGKVTGLKIGTATVTATSIADSSKHGSTTIIVGESALLSLNSPDTTVKKGGALYKYTAIASGGTPPYKYSFVVTKNEGGEVSITADTITWKSANGNGKKLEYKVTATDENGNGKSSETITVTVTTIN